MDFILYRTVAKVHRNFTACATWNMERHLWNTRISNVFYK